jgi:hypothetical protein
MLYPSGGGGRREYDTYDSRKLPITPFAPETVSTLESERQVNQSRCSIQIVLLARKSTVPVAN